MNPKIYSASNKEKEVFDSPLSCYSITQAEIQKAGSTSIPEALRLIPGLIVREQTNGVYDIHIRGFENVMRSGDVTRSNPSTLIMIDSRPIFSQIIDGAFFESLPIDINDVNRIEVIRGPAGASFGPGAAMGVINIVTRKNEEKIMVLGNVSYGRPATMMGNFSYGKKVTEKFDFIVSGNIQDRERFEKVKPGVEVNDGPGTVFIGYNGAFPDQWLALRKWGSNVFLNYEPSDKTQFGATVGVQGADVQRHTLANIEGTLFSPNEFKSYYAAVNSKMDNFSLRASLQSGKDDLSPGLGRAFPNRYDYRTIEAVAEYDLSSKGGRVHVVPGVSYQSQNISDEAYVNSAYTFFNGKSHNFTTTSAYLRADFTEIDSYRLVGALRADKFSIPDRLTFAYEFALTITVKKNYLVRVAASGSGARSSSYINYLDLNYVDGNQVSRSFKGNPDLDLFTNNLIEFGIRAKPIPEVGIDVDFFQQIGSDFTKQVSNQDRTSFSFINVPTRANQTGATFSLNILPDRRIHLKAFVTVQETKISKLRAGNGGFFDSRNLITPPQYGGYIIHIAASKKINFNISGYVCTEEDKYDKKPIHALNLKAAYSPIPQVSVYINARNIVAKNFFEYRHGDEISRLILGGVSFSLN
jgi:iron complex outermembrane receptor protein